MFDVNKITYKVRENNPDIDDMSEVIFFYEGVRCASIIIEEHWELLFFLTEFDENDLEKKFKWDKHLWLQELKVKEKFRKKGVGNKVLQIFFSEITQKYFPSYEIICLYADPFELNISLKILKKFYYKNGFKLMNIKQYIDPDYPEEELPKNNYMARLINKIGIKI